MTKLDISAVESFNDDIEDNSTMPFVSFSGKTGEWTYGFDSNDLTDTVEIGVGASTIAKGFIGWQSGECVGEHMCSIFDKKGTILVDALPKIKEESSMDGWSKQTAVNFMIGGEAYVFKGSSVGVDKFFKRLTNEIVTQHMQNPDYCNPIITVSSESYKHKKFKSTIHSPLFKVVGWLNDSGEKEVKQEAIAS